MSEGDSDKGLLSSALLVAAVSAILLTGFVLKWEPDTAAGAKPAAAPAAPPLALGSTIAQEPRSEAAAVAAPATSQPSTAIPVAPPTPAPTPGPEGVAAPPQPAADEAAPAADPLVLKLASRVEKDRLRLTRAAGRFTAQLLVACKPENVDRVLAASDSSQRLYVLPARVKDDSCFRVCYGAYATPGEASAAADLPKALRGREKIAAVEIAKVLQ